ncbi:MAG: TolC family protein [Spirochaetia bacterium]|jgi:outer membrane protein TolC
MPRKRLDERLLLVVVIFILFSWVPAAAQEASAPLSLAACIDSALSKGTDSMILERNLALSRAQYDLAASQSSYSLSASLGESATYGYGNSTLLLLNSLTSGFEQTPQAGIALATPTTTLGFNTAPYMAANPLAAEIGAFTGSTPGPSGSFGLSLSQVVWNGYPGGTARAALEKSLLTFRGRELSVVTGKQNITAAVTQAYFLALGAQRNLAVRLQILEQQNALLAQIRATHALHQATDIDLRSAEINAESADIEVQNAQSDLRIAGIRLAQLIGWPRGKELAVAEVEDPQVPVLAVEDAIAEALKRRIDVQQIELDRQSAAIDRALIRGQTTPSVSVTGGANLIVDWNLLTRAGQGSLGVTVGLPILDAGAAAHKLEANGLQNEVYAVQESELKASIATDVEEAYNLVKVQLQRLKIARLTSEKLDLQFALKKTEAQFGTATTQDVLDASVNAGDAKSAVVTAQRNAQLATLQLRTAMGY